MLLIFFVLPLKSSLKVLFAIKIVVNDHLVKGAASLFVHLEKCSLNFSSSSFVIRVNLLHP